MSVNEGMMQEIDVVIQRLSARTSETSPRANPHDGSYDVVVSLEASTDRSLGMSQSRFVHALGWARLSGCRTPEAG